MSLLVISEIFRLFVTTLSPDDKYSVRNMHIFREQLQILFSQKKQAFYQFLIAFLKCARNLEHSKKKEVFPSLINNEIFASERDVYLSV